MGNNRVDVLKVRQTVVREVYCYIVHLRFIPGRVKLFAFGDHQLALDCLLR